MRLLIILCVFFVGCASIKYHDFEYYRLGNQELIGVEIEQQGSDGSWLRARIESQKSEREIAEILFVMSQNINKMLEVLTRKVPDETNQND